MDIDLTDNLKAGSRKQHSPADSLTITRHAADLTLNGVVDATTDGQLSQALLETIAEGHRDIRLTMGDVRYLDSAGLKVLLAALRRLRAIGGTITLIGCGPMLDRTLRITGFDSCFIRDDGETR